MKDDLLELIRLFEGLVGISSDGLHLCYLDPETSGFSLVKVSPEIAELVGTMLISENGL